VEYQIIGRKKPTPTDPKPKVYRMIVFAPNIGSAKTRFWYYMRSLQRVKRSNGEILSVNRLFEKRPERVKNFHIALRYKSSTSEHNITKEFRDVTRVGAVNQMLMDMAGRHRTRSHRLQIMQVKEVASKDVVRPATKQFINSKIKFPLPHRVLRAPSAQFRTKFKARRPSTHFG